MMKYKLTDLQRNFPSHYMDDLVIEEENATSGMFMLKDEEDSIFFSSLDGVESFLADRHEHIVDETNGDITQKEWEEMKLDEMISLFGYKLEEIQFKLLWLI